MRTLDRRSPTPLWAQLAGDLEARIVAGEFSERFPTDEELVRDYEVSRQTAREAVRRLREAGVVERQRGRGSFLRRPPSLEQPVAAFYSLAQSITERGMAERSEVLSFGPARSEEAARQLGLAEEAEVALIERLRFAGDEPLALDRSWLPAEVADGIDGEALASGSLYSLLYEKKGLRVTGGHERIRAVRPDSATAKLLRLPAQEAGLVVERLAFAGTRAIEWRVSTYRGDRFSFSADWTNPA